MLWNFHLESSCKFMLPHHPSNSDTSNLSQSWNQLRLQHFVLYQKKKVYKDNSQVTSWCRFISPWSPTFVLQVKKTNFPDQAFSVFIPSFPCAQAKGFQLLEENLIVQPSSVSFHSSPGWWERNLVYHVLLLFVSGVGFCSLYESNVGVEEWQIVRDVVLLT